MTGARADPDGAGGAASARRPGRAPRTAPGRGAPRTEGWPGRVGSLRLLLVDSGRVWRGGQNQVRLLVRELLRRGDVEPAVVTAAGSRLAGEVRALGVPVFGAPWRIGFDPRAVLRVAGRAPDSDLVHVHDSHALQAAWVALCLTGAPAPLVATRHVTFPSRAPGLWRRSDLILAVSQAARRSLLRRGIEGRRVRVVHSAVAPGELEQTRPGRLRAAAVADADAPLVGSVAALDRGKGHATFVRAAARVAREKPDARFVVAGEGPDRDRLERLVAGLGLRGRFHLAGHVSDAALSLRDLDVFVLCSTEEGLGTAALEAMAVGVPVVLARAGGLAEVVGRGIRSAPPGDPDAFAEEVMSLLGDRARREEAARAGRERLERFTAREMARRTVGAYREVLRSAERERRAARARRSGIVGRGP